MATRLLVPAAVLAPVLVALTLVVAAAAPPAARAASAPDRGTAFVPRPASTPLYATKAPSEAPEAQQHVVAAADGTDLFVETWLPAPKGGATPPARVPTILIMTPYVQNGVERYPSRDLEPVIAYFTARGYAVAQHHVRGTGSSGGCLEQTAANQIDDGARVVEYLGRDAPWASGAVGMYGISYDAETQISVAGRGDPARTKYLKAIVPAETVGGQYEYSNMDGVPYAGQAALSNGAYLATTSLAPGEAPVGVHTFERFGCQPDLALGSADTSGDLTPFWKLREYRAEVPAFKAATLWVHGFADWNVLPITIAASFDRLPAGTPHKAILGQWEHNFPDKHAGVQPDWERQDWLDLVTAWYDRYLKDLPTGVEGWPAVQLQGTDGRWRGEPGFPQTGGPAGQLALGPEGALGVRAPTGSTTFTEGPDDRESVPGTRAVFTTPPLPAPLELSGQPIADLMVRTSQADAHLTAKLQVLGADGEALTHDGSSSQELGTFGTRSLRHLDDLPDGYFVQEAGHDAPTEGVLRVPLRLQPVDLVVPAGGALRLTIAGATDWARQTVPSGAGSTIEIVHDCTRPSALRFLLPHADAPLLNVRETDEKTSTSLAEAPVATGRMDADGAAVAAVCGRAPERPAFAGPATPIAGTAPGAAPGGGCRDTVAPTSRPRSARRLRGRRLTLQGTARDKGCGSAAAPRRVSVSVARKTAAGCRFLARSGRLGALRPCTRTGGTYLPARGTTRWTFTTRRALPRGRYQVWTRATDAAGNVERKKVSRNLRRLRV